MSTPVPPDGVPGHRAPADPPSAKHSSAEHSPAHHSPAEQRPHWATPIIRGWIVLAAVGVTAGKQLFDSWQAGDHLPPVKALLFLAGAVLVVALVQAIIGFFQWRTTRFRIDDEEVRVDRRFIRHSSDRIALSKVQSVDVVQPLAARIFGLARLHIDIGASRPRTIEYLGRADAYRFRDFLTTRARAAGAAVTPTAPSPAERGAVTPSAAMPPEAMPSGSLWQDRRIDERAIVRLSSRQIVLGTFVSSGFVGSLLVIALGIAVPVGLHVEAVSAPVVAGGLIAAVGVITKSLMKYWHYTLLDSAGGLKAVHGMTTLTTRTVPVQRVQGIVVSQPLTWRLTGLYSVRMTVLGVAGADDTVDAGMLVPMGSAQQVHDAVEAVWPGFDINGAGPMTPVQTRPIPARARWLRWIDRRVFRWGRNWRVVVARRGLFTRVTTMVPHTRVQSMSLSQGPLQRRLGLATIGFHLPAGPVHQLWPHLDAEEARTLLLEEMGLGRGARSHERSVGAPRDPEDGSAEGLSGTPRRP